MKKLYHTTLITTGATVFASAAFAHHPLAGAPMETFTHGVLSGAGHPILGFDHLFFIALLGICAVYTGRALLAPLGFVAAMLAGTALVSFGFALPAVELMIIASLLVFGGIVASGRALSLKVAMVLFALAGLFHGGAFGASIAGQETAVGSTVMFGYLLGLGIVQYLIALGAGVIATRLWKSTKASDIAPRLAGAALGGIGVFLLLETGESAVFASLGLG